MRRIPRNNITRNHYGPRTPDSEHYFVKSGETTLADGENKDEMEKRMKEFEERGFTVRLERLLNGSLEVIG